MGVISKITFFIAFLAIGCTTKPGAICYDGTKSNSTNQGTCSWHGGVKEWVQGGEIDYLRTFILITLVISIAYFFLFKKKK